MEILTRKNGIILSIIGIVIFLLNFLTYSLWRIDIDILGLFIFILGLVIAIACGKTMKKSSRLLTRKNGVLLCILSTLIIFITGYLPFINGDFGGMLGIGVFLLGIILIIFRWNY